VPEMIELAGGFDALGRKGGDSVRIERQDVLRWAPEIVIVSPCGAHLESSIEQATEFLRDPYWSTLPAIESGEVYAVDASSYFARPGPRVFDGIEVLAHLFHPERIPERLSGSSRRITASEGARSAERGRTARTEAQIVGTESRIPSIETPTAAIETRTATTKS